MQITIEILNNQRSELVHETFSAACMARLKKAFTTARSFAESPAALTKPILRELIALRDDGKDAVGKSNAGVAEIAKRIKRRVPAVSRTLKRITGTLAARRKDGSIIATPAGIVYALFKHPVAHVGTVLTVDKRDTEGDSSALCWLLWTVEAWDEIIAGRLPTARETHMREILGKATRPLTSVKISTVSALMGDSLSRFTVPKLLAGMDDVVRRHGGYEQVVILADLSK